MQKLTALVLSLATTLVLYHPVSNAVPQGLMKIVYAANPDGTFTYVARLRNMGPTVRAAVMTPLEHQIYDSRTQQSYAAGGKALTEDDNIIAFGIDTKSDDVTISNVGNGFQTRDGEEVHLQRNGEDAHSHFIGGALAGFSDSDNDGIVNKAIGWHLPFDIFTLEQTLGQGDTIWSVTFTLDQAITDFVYWVGGSDDTTIWNFNNIMLQDSYGIYDATEEAYLAVFLRRSLNAEQVELTGLWESFSF